MAKWKHKKYGNRVYKGYYAIETKSLERCFVLSAKLKNGKMHNVAFESWQAAKKLGWFIA